jgi:hypothetical protein
MSLRFRARYTLLPIFLLLILLLALTTASSYAGSAKGGPLTVSSYELLGEVIFPTGTMFGSTEVGGLSGITYDASRGVYYVLADDRSPDARYYTVEIDLSDGSLDEGDVTFEHVTFLRQQTGGRFEAGSLDPESIEMPRSGYLYISSEGDSDATPTIDPFVNRFNPGGKQTRALPIPDYYLPSGDGTEGVRDNLAFESLTSTPNRRWLFAATENALEQDGPASTLTDYSPSRFLAFSLSRKQPGAEFVYMVNPIPKAPIPSDQFADNGLSDAQSIDNAGTFLAMERSFAVGVGNTVRMFETSIQGATNVSGVAALPSVSYVPMEKSLVFDFEDDLGVVPDNLEALTFGPPLPDGRQVLIAVSDNNFNPTQKTQFVAIAIELAPATD